MRPCGHETVACDCRVCWLHVHDPRYARLFGPVPEHGCQEFNKTFAPVESRQPATAIRLCVHAGIVIEEAAGCSRHLKHVRLCLLPWGRCTIGANWRGRPEGLQSCTTCPEFAAGKETA